MNILLTGGTGSLGAALCQHFLDYPPERLVVFSRDWHKQSALRAQLKDPAFVRWFIGDVRDRDRLWRALDGIDVVIHAAALKQIDAAEYNPSEAVQTNVIGAQNVIGAAIDRKVSKVLVVSTDKACEAANVYGKTKALAENLAVASNVYATRPGTRISVVRYGNVMGSSGSVIPLFQSQAEDGTLTITDRRMTRFWITMQDSVELVLACLARMQGGEIFIPKIPSARIVDVAAAVGPGCHVAEMGIRPGEKLHECLISKQEAQHTKELDDHYAIEPEFEFWQRDCIEGKSLADGWDYTSDTNKNWLSVEDIRALIGG